MIKEYPLRGGVDNPSYKVYEHGGSHTLTFHTWSSLGNPATQTHEGGREGFERPRLWLSGYA
jgi:hypothetical protein